MVQRRFWSKQIEEAWKRRSVLWLSGVRRVGKTVLSQSLPDIEYFDCELPRVRRMIDDPEGLLESLRRRQIVLDEIHRLRNPSTRKYGELSVTFVGLAELVVEVLRATKIR